MDAATGLLYAALASCQEAAPPKRVFIGNAVHTADLQILSAQMDLEVRQTFKPEAEALSGAGIRQVTRMSGQYDLIAIRPSKNKVQTLGWVAEGMAHLKPGGILLLVAENAHGARSLEQHLAAVAPIMSQSKSKCRLLRLHNGDAVNRELCDKWLADASPSRQPVTGLWSCPGLFSWSEADAGSLLLLEHLPPSLNGAGIDLCCGYGLLGCTLLQRHPGIEMLHMLDVDRLALDMVERNSHAYREKVRLHWGDASRENLPSGLDWLVCNPPFHEGQERDVGLGQKIIDNACRALKPGGRLWLVANRKLPYEKVLEQGLRKMDVVVQERGYKIMTGIR